MAMIAATTRREPPTVSVRSNSPMRFASVKLPLPRTVRPVRLAVMSIPSGAVSELPTRLPGSPSLSIRVA